ncbi:MAG: hypothetical protein U9R56_05045 [candidate division Zixibacteria bacterium]|nr:hypothetical protein [candidate division Zixibacteria bacterium]
MCKALLMLLVMSVIVPAGNVSCEEPKIVVGDVDLPMRWGTQQAVFKVTNKTEGVRFLTIEVEVQFEGSYLNPNRRVRSHFLLLPMTTEVISPTVYIPGSYGRAKATITIYDVVDTLDALLPGQKFFQQYFSMMFHPPEAVFDYQQEVVTLPPRVENHYVFDSEFSRIFLLMLNEGKSLEKIADITAADLVFVKETLEAMIAKRYVIMKDSTAVIQFPVITVKEAEQAKQLAERTSDSLAQMIQSNFPRYWQAIDSLVADGVMSADSNVFLNGGTVLYRPYPVVSALVLWFDLGQKFITRSAPLLIYDHTDLCNADIPFYMYAVQGGDYFNGTHFYKLSIGNNYLQIFYGDSPPHIDCDENFILQKRLGRKVRWTYSDGHLPESFVVDTAVVRPALNALTGDADSLLWQTYLDLRDIAVEYGHKKAAFGIRYWFWNLVATRTLVKLTSEGIVERRGNGQYKFEGVQL